MPVVGFDSELKVTLPFLLECFFYDGNYIGHA